MGKLILLPCLTKFPRKSEDRARKDGVILTKRIGLGHSWSVVNNSAEGKRTVKIEEISSN